jgi:hypothetical protein
MYAALLKRRTATKEAKRQKRLEKCLKEKRSSFSVEVEKTVGKYYEDYRPKYAPTKVCIQFGGCARRITENAYFVAFMNAVILLAGVLVGMQTYSVFETNAVIERLDLMVLVAFCVEIVLKIVADPLRPYNYFVGPEWAWNNFDFLIVVVCFVLPGGSGAVLRLLRLLRVLKLLKSNEQMRMILFALAAGIKSAVFVFVLMFLIYYMYAALGIMMFSGQVSNTITTA